MIRGQLSEACILSFPLPHSLDQIFSLQWLTSFQGPFCPPQRELLTTQLTLESSIAICVGEKLLAHCGDTKETSRSLLSLHCSGLSASEFYEELQWIFGPSLFCFCIWSSTHQEIFAFHPFLCFAFWRTIWPQRGLVWLQACLFITSFRSTGSAAVVRGYAWCSWAGPSVITEGLR